MLPRPHRTGFALPRLVAVAALASLVSSALPALAPGPAAGRQTAAAAPSAAGFAKKPVARWVASAGVAPGVSNLVGSWSSSGPAALVVAQDAMRSWPRLDTTLAAGSPALVFDGNDSLAASAGLPSGSSSRALAVRVDDLADGGILLGATSGDAVRVLAGSGLLAYEQGGGAIHASALLIPGVFHTIVTTWHAPTGAARIYVDGALVAAGSLPAPADLALGFAASKYGGFPLTGALAEVRLYAHALSDAERRAVEAQLDAYRDPAFPTADFTSLPRDAQVLQRGAHDSVQVAIEGVVRSTGYDEAVLAVLRDGQPYASHAVPLDYGESGALFTLAATLDAGFFDYDLMVSVKSASATTVVASRRNVCVGDTFLVDGQSNAVAKDWHAEGLGDDHQSHWIRSFGDGQWVKVYGPPPVVSAAEHNKDLNWDVARSLVPHDHATIGQWALRMAELLSAASGLPIAVINGGSEGSSILAHLRNDEYPTDPSGLYGRLLYRAQQAGIAGHARAILYYQGESDGEIPEVWASSFDAMRAGWLMDYSALERIYVFQIREGCAISNDGVREAQRKLGELYPDVAVMSTTAVPTHDACHYYHHGYLKIGERMARMIARDLYGTPVLFADPPRIVNAAWQTSAQDALVLTFEPPGVPLVVDPGVEAHTSVDDGTPVTSVTILGPGRLRVELAAPSTATAVTWRGHAYDGPWIENPAGVGALAFFDFPVTP